MALRRDTELNGTLLVMQDKYQLSKCHEANCFDYNTQRRCHRLRTHSAAEPRLVVGGRPAQETR